MATSGSGAGGKIVTNRRKQRLAATPYDRPPPPPPPKSPNWFTGVIVPSARAIVSGAGKILSSILSESESSSSEDEDSASEDDVDADNDCETPYSRVNVLDETNVTPSEMMQFGQESQLNAWRTETKRIIEQLIMHETFSREECDRLIKILNSRVIDWSVEAGEKSSLAGSPRKMVDHEDDIYNKAIQEAKKWFQEKKVGSSSATQLDHGIINLNLIGVEHVESGGGSPADVARSYMKERPPWASPTSNVEIRTPLTTKLFKDRTSYSVARDSLSSSRKRNSLASGSWNIQEELRRVRSKATEEMLRTPTKIDSSLLAAQPTREESVAADEVVPAIGERTTEPNPLSKTKQIEALVDAGVSPDPSLSVLESRPAKVNEAQSSKPATSVSRNNEDSGAVQVDGEHDASKFPYTSTPNHAGEHQSDGRLSDTNGPPAIDATKFGGKQSASANANGLSKASLSEGHLPDQNNEQHNEENHTSNTTKKEKPASNTVNAEGNCKLLTEAYTEVPVVAETNSLTSGSQNSLSMQNEELPVEIAQPSPKRKADAGAGKQQGRKSARIKGRGRGRGGK